MKGVQKMVYKENICVDYFLKSNTINFAPRVCKKWYVNFVEH